MDHGEHAGSRVLVAELGQDGHDRGSRLVARLLRDAGFEVIDAGRCRTPETVVAAARDEDVDAVGLWMPAGAPLALAPAVVEGLRAERLDTPVVVGGTVPEPDVSVLREAGIAAVLGPGATAGEVAAAVERAIAERAG